MLNISIEEFFPKYIDLLAEKIEHVLPRHTFIPLLLNGTEAMISDTNPSLTNEDVFKKTFFKEITTNQDYIYQLFSDFYLNEFPSLGVNYQGIQGSQKVLDLAIEKKLTIVLATNPLFPIEAIEERLRWAGLENYPFSFMTTFDVMHACKPQVEYYKEILEKLDLSPEECLMVGNDTLEDLIAGTLGIKTFLLTDMAIERKNRYKSDYEGSMEDLFEFLVNL